MNSLSEIESPLFPTYYKEILQRVGSIDPLRYGRSRNFIDGSVTYLSPYISRGVISTKTVLSKILDKGYRPDTIEKFIQELAWRDYWQQIWRIKGEAINKDLKNKQHPVSSTGIPKSLLEASTGIKAIDNAITTFYKTGYLHNHVRMYIASLACNIGQCHWKSPAKWMYYYLLDADWGSNALSWQWVAGTNSKKKYIANQENINKYCYTEQKGTFLDVPYAVLAELPIPDLLKETVAIDWKTNLPTIKTLQLKKELPTLLYNFYNLDPLWKNNIAANRVLLLEPSHFKKYPISQNTLDFVMALSENIRGIQIFIGEFDEFVRSYSPEIIYFKEHPFNEHYRGVKEARDWMFSVEGDFPSFFSFWKKCKKELK